MAVVIIIRMWAETIIMMASDVIIMMAAKIILMMAAVIIIMMAAVIIDMMPGSSSRSSFASFLGSAVVVTWLASELS